MKNEPMTGRGGEMGGACYGMVMPHALGSNRACLYCEAHRAIKRMQNRPFEPVEQWAERMAANELAHMEAINSILPLPVRPLLGTVLTSHPGAVALWIGKPGERLMGFSVVHVDQQSAALDEMVRLDQEMGGR